MAHLAKYLALGFGSGHDLMDNGFEPWSGSLLGRGSASRFSPFSPLMACDLHAPSLSHK